MLAEIVLGQDLATDQPLPEVGRAAAGALARVDPHGSFLQNELALDELDELSKRLLTCGEPQSLLARKLIEWITQVRQAPRPGEQWMKLSEIIEYVFGPSPQGKSEQEGWTENNSRNIRNYIKDRRLRAIPIRHGLYAVDVADLERLKTIYRKGTDDRKSPLDPPPSNGIGPETDRK